MTWTDTVIFGYFKSTEVVGVEAKYASIHADVQEIDDYECFHGCVYACCQKSTPAVRSKLGICSFRYRLLCDYSLRKYAGQHRNEHDKINREVYSVQNRHSHPSGT